MPPLFSSAVTAFTSGVSKLDGRRVVVRIMIASRIRQPPPFSALLRLSLTRRPHLGVRQDPGRVSRLPLRDRRQDAPEWPPARGRRARLLDAMVMKE
jgi:hypothetical protein